MGLLDVFSRARGGPARRAAPPGDLFDEEFQRKLETLAIVSRRVVAGRMRAERRSKKKGSGVEFADHREYAPGDDFRAVDWNAYGRLDRLLVRLYEEEEDLGIHFIVDASRSMAFGDGRKFSHALRLTAALAYVGLANLDRVGVTAVTDHVVGDLPPTRGKARIFKVFEFLRRLEPSGQTSLADAVSTVVRRSPRRGLAVLVSALYDPAGFERGVNVLRYNRFEPYLLHVVDPADATPAVRGDVALVDCETGDLREVTVTDGLLARVREAHAAYLAEVARFCTKGQVPCFTADVNVPFEELVLRVFRRGGFLR